MRKRTTAVLLIAVSLCASSADAQLFGKKSKTPPAQRLGELLGQAKGDASDSKRAAAAEELGSFDAKAFPELGPGLIDIARSDKSASVRIAALDSLARLRPVTPAAGQTLEWAAAHDDSWKVRWNAKTALTRYQWAGYRPGKAENKNAVPPSTGEPPLIDAARPQVKPGTVSRTTPKINQAPANVQAQPPQLPKVVNQPSGPVVVTPPPPRNVSATRPNLPVTPPPIIVESPPAAIAPPMKVPAPAFPVVDPNPKTGSVPPLPVIVTTPGPVEPNFRPAGPTPPRAAPPAPKNDDKGPALTPPM